MTPFLLVPGLNCDARVYGPVTPALWQYGPVTIANHLSGDGVAEIARVILAAAPPRFALAGFSFGGYLAFEILRQARERVLKLALIDTSARQDTPELTETRQRRIALAQSGKFGPVIEQSFPASVHPDNVGESRLYSLHRTMSEANGPDVYVRHQEAIIGRPDSRPLLASIGGPTVVVVGEGDQITPPDAAREMQAGISGSSLAVIPRAGHLALLEQPELVAAALKSWAAA
jgi:pimeloyl-ACP methyl ester carboxylesterase